MNRSSKLLISENPLMVLPSLAVLIGLTPAIYLQQLHYWLRVVASNNKVGRIEHGLPWYRNSAIGWRDNNFPFWTTKTIERTGRKLEAMNLVWSANLNYIKTDKTKWYTINYDLLDFISDHEIPLGHFVLMEKDTLSDWIRTKYPNAKPQNVLMLKDFSSYSLSETPKSEIPKSEIPSDTQALHEWKEILEELSSQMAKDTFNNLLRGSKAVSDGNGGIIVFCKNESAKDWLQGRLANTVGRTVSDVLQKKTTVSYEVIQ